MGELPAGCDNDDDFWYDILSAALKSGKEVTVYADRGVHRGKVQAINGHGVQIKQTWLSSGVGRDVFCFVTLSRIASVTVEI